MEEAVQLSMPRELRMLFATILIHGQPTNALELWNQHLHSMIEDFVRDYPEDVSKSMAYSHIDSIINSARMSLLSDFGIRDSFSGRIGVDIEEFGSANLVDHNEIGFERYAQLNNGQKYAVDTILNAVLSNSTNRLYFIDGPGGTGKTFLYETLYHLLKAKDFEIISVTWTGIAALLLPNGVTLHSRFKLPLKIDATSTIGIRAGSKAAREINAANVMFLDEASMCSANVLNIIDRGLQDIRDCTLPFGGMFLILGGDFRQILPVIRHGNRAQLIQQCIKSSALWNQFLILPLSQNMRANSEEVEFAEWLLQVGNGVANDDQQNVQVPDSQIVRSDMAVEIFGETILSSELNSLHSKIILCSTNDKVHELNNQVIQKLSGESVFIKSIDQVICEPGEDTTEYPVEFLNTLLCSGLPPHELHLKIGAIVMLLRNLDIKNGLCNGVRLKIVRILTNILDCEIVTGSFVGKRVLLPKIKLEPTDDIFPFTL